MDVNCVILEGRLVKNAEFSVKDDVKISRFTIASDSIKKTEDGKFAQKASFFRLAVFGNYAESLTPYLVKGRKITVVGKLDQDTYENKDGQKRSRIEVKVKEVSLGALPASGTPEPEAPDIEEYEYEDCEPGEYVEGYGDLG